MNEIWQFGFLVTDSESSSDSGSAPFAADIFHPPKLHMSMTLSIKCCRCPRFEKFIDAAPHPCNIDLGTKIEAVAQNGPMPRRTYL